MNDLDFERPPSYYEQAVAGGSVVDAVVPSRPFATAGVVREWVGQWHDGLGGIRGNAGINVYRLTNAVRYVTFEYLVAVIGREAAEKVGAGGIEMSWANAYWPAAMTTESALEILSAHR